MNAARVQALASPLFLQNPCRFGPWVWATLRAGEMVYRIVLQPENGASGCTCVWRSRPCLHVRALAMWLEQNGAEAFALADNLPAWAPDVVDGRRVQSNENAEAKASRRRERLERAENGMLDLEQWMEDLARRGLVALLENPSLLNTMAARLADASLGGVSRRLRLLSATIAQTPNWPEKCLHELSGLWLGLRAFQQRDRLPGPLLDDLEQFIGINAKKEDVLSAGERVNDTWAVLGTIRETLEESLNVRRTWLIGLASGRWALFLEYGFADALPPGFAGGSLLSGTLAFYPSALPLRALPANDLQMRRESMQKMPGAVGMNQLQHQYASALGKQPWLELFPVSLHGVVPRLEGAQWLLHSTDGAFLHLTTSEENGWKLLALGGGSPLSIFGEWDGFALRPLSALAGGRFVVLENGKG